MATASTSKEKETQLHTAHFVIVDKLATRKSAKKNTPFIAGAVVLKGHKAVRPIYIDLKENAEIDLSTAENEKNKVITMTRVHYVPELKIYRATMPPAMVSEA